MKLLQRLLLGGCLIATVMAVGAELRVERDMEAVALYDYYDYLLRGDAQRIYERLAAGAEDDYHWRSVKSRWYWPIEERATLLRFRFHTPDDLSGPLGFVIKATFLREAHMLLVGPNGTVQQVSMGVLVQQREDVVGDRQLFGERLPVEPDRYYRLYVLLDDFGLSAGPIINGSWLLDWEYYLQRERPARSALIGTCLGAVALLLLFTAALMVLQRSLLMLAALAYLVGIWGSLALREGMLYEWFANSEWWLTDGMFLFVTLRNAGVVLFAAVVLGLWRHRWGRWLATAGVLANAVGAVMLIFSAPGDYWFLLLSLTATTTNFVVLLGFALRRAFAGGLWNVVVGTVWSLYFVVGGYELFYPLFPNPHLDPELLSDLLLIITAVWVYQAVMRDAVLDNQGLVRQRARNEARMDFLARLSHEIRTPLNAIIGMTDVLKQGGMDDSQRYSLSVIANAGNTLLGLVNNILDFTKIESGEFALKSAPFQLDRAALGASNTFIREIYETELGGFLIVEPDVPLCVIGDELRLRQVLINLIGNAFKYTERGRVIIRIDHRGPTADGRAILGFSVEDTGPGIPQDKLDTLFDAFTRVEDDSRSQAGGTGLGLAICKRLVELNGGQISVHSRIGEGTTMFFTWPVAVDQRAETMLRARWMPLQGKRILIMIPEDLIGSIIVPYLEALGVQTHWVRSIDEAIAAADAQSYDAAVLDCFVGVDLDDERLDRFLDRGISTILAVVHEPSREFDAYPNARIQFVPTYVSHWMDVLVNATSELSLPEESGVGAESEDFAELAVLVVDDNPLNLLVACRLLESFGIQPATATSGRVALTMLRERRFDLVFMDCEMPGMDGFEVTARWRAIEAERGAKPVRVYAFTAHSSEDVSQRAEHCAMQGILVKPVTRERLRQLLQEIKGGRA